MELNPKKAVLLLILMVFATALVVTVATSRAETFGKTEFSDVNYTLVGNYYHIDLVSGLQFRLGIDTVGSNIIYLNGSYLVSNERWELQYSQGQQWKTVGTSQKSYFHDYQPHHKVFVREFDDFLGTRFNVTYDFFSASNPKITISGYVQNPYEYRLVWFSSGINTTEAYDEPSLNRVRINGTNKDFKFDYLDVYRSLGNITITELVKSQGNHQLTLIIPLGTFQGSFTVDPSFGKTDIGGSESAYLPNYCNVFKHTLTEDGTVYRLRIYAKASASSLDVKGCIYDDDGVGSIPDTLLIEGSTHTYNTTLDWYTLQIPDTFLSAGDYWIGVATGSGDSLYIRYDASAGQDRYDTITFPTLNNPWTNDGQNDLVISLYAEYTATVYELNLTNPTQSTTQASHIGTFTVLAQTNGTPAYAWLSHNFTGSWLNETRISWSSTPETVSTTQALPSTIGLRVAYQWYANNTQGIYNSSAVTVFTTTNIFSLNLTESYWLGFAIFGLLQVIAWWKRSPWPMGISAIPAVWFGLEMFSANLEILGISMIGYALFSLAYSINEWG